MSEYFSPKFNLITQTSKNQPIKYNKGYQHRVSDICTKNFTFLTWTVSPSAGIKIGFTNAREIFHQMQKTMNIVFTKLFVYFCIADQLEFRTLSRDIYPLSGLINSINSVLLLSSDLYINYNDNKEG
jgi:hypothetical protein